MDVPRGKRPRMITTSADVAKRKTAADEDNDSGRETNRAWIASERLNTPISVAIQDQICARID